jgi:hypothetical protein
MRPSHTGKVGLEPAVGSSVLPEVVCAPASCIVKVAVDDADGTLVSGKETFQVLMSEGAQCQRNAPRQLEDRRTNGSVIPDVRGPELRPVDIVLCEASQSSIGHSWRAQRHTQSVSSLLFPTTKLIPLGNWVG